MNLALDEIHIPIDQIVERLGSDKSWAFLFFHAFSGCETTLSLSGKGKKIFFDSWTSMNEIAPLFKKLCSIAAPDKITGDDFELLEFFVMRLYSKTCSTKR